MSYLIDRRLNAKHKSTVNRQRFLRRYRNHIRKAVSDAIGNRSITDVDKGERIVIPGQDVSEPTIQHGAGGKQTTVYAGNKKFVAGDRIARKGGSGSGGGRRASDSGEGMDEFAFQISQDEFLDFMFDDLELPNLVKRQLAGTDSFKYHHGGYTNVGNPNQINVVRSLRSAQSRRIALGGKDKRRLKAAEAELELLLSDDSNSLDDASIRALKAEIDRLKGKISRIPFLDDFDIKYNLHIKVPQPSSKAVMFCLMDVSGSMDQHTKDLAKRFFILLYLFLKRNYDHIDIVFIRHHTSAKEVDEEEFFYSRETGGTVVSSALKLMSEIMQARYPLTEWNIYGAEASDGDNWNDDSNVCSNVLLNQIMPYVQFFSYIEITQKAHQQLWQDFERVQQCYPDSLSMQQIAEARDIYPVFREFFQRRTTT